MFDAINATGGSYESYAYDGSAVNDASPVAAGATAAHRVASALYSAADEVAVWNASLAESLASIPDDAARAKGIQLGESIAQTILQLRANDGSTAPESYTYGSGPGAWQRTYPDYLPPLLSQWPDVTPFVIANPVDFRVEAPPELSSAEYAAAVDEVLRLGAVDSSERTADQTQIAIFWADGGGTATPPGHWNRIATDVVNQESLALVDSARSLALLNLAMADAGIASWDNKYAYDLWRPIDAIRLADTDGNSATAADTSWLPLLRTPPFPTYTSGHSTFSGAAAAVLTHLFGDNYAFASTTDAHSAPGQRPLDESLIVTRHFTSFNQAAQEAGLSRIYGGIHFSFDNTAGLAAGDEVGSSVVSSVLRPTM
jgi:membrane-associated phospholipid phosphatase